MGVISQVSMEDCVPIGSNDAGDSPPDLPNSRYWRDMGHPWGGLHSTAVDIATLLQAMLEGGRGLWSPPTLRAMISDQNSHLPGRAWGLGWSTSRSGSSIRSGNPSCDLGDLLSAASFGHTGSVGSLAWADPESQTVCVICSDTNAKNGTLRRRASNAVAAALAQASTYSANILMWGHHCNQHAPSHSGARL